MMQTAANINLVLIDLSSKSGFADSQTAVSDDTSYLHVFLSEWVHALQSRRAFQELTDKLLRIAEHAYCLRDMKTVQEAALILMNLPMDSARQVGQYYQALAFKKMARRIKPKHYSNRLRSVRHLRTGREQFKHWVLFITNKVNLTMRYGSISKRRVQHYINKRVRTGICSSFFSVSRRQKIRKSNEEGGSNCASQPQMGSVTAAEAKAAGPGAAGLAELVAEVADLAAVGWAA